MKVRCRCREADCAVPAPVIDRYARRITNEQRVGIMHGFARIVIVKPATKRSSLRVQLRNGVIAAGMLLWSTGAAAQTTVTMPDTSQTTTVSASVSEQARITVPAGIAFSVTNIGAVTVANAATLTVDQIVLSSATKQLRVSLQANTGSFAPPVGGAVTWGAADVSWNAAAWTGATGTAGTLSNSVYNAVATCNAGATACSTTALTFSLAPKPSVQRAGAHTLVVTWKVESIGS